jgi:hypothetical protein
VEPTSPGAGDPKLGGDVFERSVTVVVRLDHLPFPDWQVSDRLPDPLGEGMAVRFLLRIGGHIVRAGGEHRPQVEARDVRIRRPLVVSPPPGPDTADGRAGIDAVTAILCSLALLGASAPHVQCVLPIAPSQSVQDRAANLVVRESDKGDVPRRIEPIHGRHEAGRSYRAEIVERHRQRVSAPELVGQRPD